MSERTLNDALRIGMNDSEIPPRTNHNPPLPSLGKKSVPDQHTGPKPMIGMSKRGFMNPMGDLAAAAKKRLKNAPGLRR